MTSSFLRQSLPSTAELPCSDDTPVDNEEQNLLPNLLLMLLTHAWADRFDWFFGVDMAVYHTTGVNSRVPVVPDAFLSIGVKRWKGEKYRRSYATWEEKNIVPAMALEMVSHQLGGEYDRKMALYSGLGVLYYVIYNPEFWQRDGHQPFEVYRLKERAYELQVGEPYWMPEVGLGIGRYQGEIGGLTREILTWYDASGCRLLDAAEEAKGEATQVNLQLEQEVARRKRLEAILKENGINPDEVD